MLPHSLDTENPKSPYCLILYIPENHQKHILSGLRSFLGQKSPYSVIMMELEWPGFPLFDLPAELSRKIIGEFLDQEKAEGSRIYSFASVNRVFKDAVEERTFDFHGVRPLRLCPLDICDFNNNYTTVVWDLLSLRIAEEHKARQIRLKSLRFEVIIDDLFFALRHINPGISPALFQRLVAAYVRAAFSKLLKVLEGHPHTNHLAFEYSIRFPSPACRWQARQ